MFNGYYKFIFIRLEYFFNFIVHVNDNLYIL